MTDPLLKLTPPHDEAAERACLGACLLWPEAFDEVQARVSPTAWYKPVHAALWVAIAALRARSAPVDVLTVRAELEARGALEQVGGEAFLAELSETLASPANVAYYADRVRDLASKRELIRAGHAITMAGYELGLSLQDTLARAETELATAVGRPVFRRATGADMAKELLESLARAQRGEDLRGHLTGFHELDELTLGLQPGEFSAIGARTSMGKTTFALALAARLLTGGVKVGIVSLEMPRLQLARHVAAAWAEVDGQRLRAGALTSAENARVLDAAEWLAQAPLVVDDAPPGPGPLVVSRVRSLIARDRCAVVILDYLQLIQITDPRAGENEIAAVSQQLKAITREHPHAHVMAICQLNRDVEKRRDHEPMSSDLRGSGQLEQDLDLIMMLLRPSYYDREADPRLTQVHVLKQRNGATGVVELSFNRACLRFDNKPEGGFESAPERPKRRSRFRGKNAHAKAGEDG